LASATRAQPPAEKGEKGAPPTEAKPLDRAELDRRIARVVNEAIMSGVVLWQNQKEEEAVRVEGTFRLFQGTLAAVVPMLDHRPELQKSAGYKLHKGSGMRAVEGAFILRGALDEIQKATAAALVVKPLWERLGGEAGV